MNIVPVNVKKACDYNICIDESFDAFKDVLSESLSDASNVLIITDDTVKTLYLTEFEKIIPTGVNVYSLSFNPREALNSFDNLSTVLEFCTGKNFSCKDMLIALGGGTVSDLTGFAASIYKRGIGYCIVPTTLLSIVDASIGGKTTIDYKGIKNVLSAFYMPKLSLVALDTLNSLSERQFYSGFSEIMKIAIISDAKFYEWLVENMYEISEKNPEAILEMVSKATTLKKTIVEKDPFEKKERVLLNLGHTVGRALEIYFDGKYSHGECVALGTVAEAFISYKAGLLKMEEYYEIRDMFVPFNLPISITVNKADYPAIYEYMLNDKKNVIDMVLVKKIGKCEFAENIFKEQIYEALDELNFDEKE